MSTLQEMRIADLEEALRRIAELDPSEDSEEGWNEWDLVDCFNQAQKIAKEALEY